MTKKQEHTFKKFAQQIGAEHGHKFIMAHMDLKRCAVDQTAPNDPAYVSFIDTKTNCYYACTADGVKEYNHAVVYTTSAGTFVAGYCSSWQDTERLTIPQEHQNNLRSVARMLFVNGSWVARGACVKAA